MLFWSERGGGGVSFAGVDGDGEGGGGLFPGRLGGGGTSGEASLRFWGSRAWWARWVATRARGVVLVGWTGWTALSWLRGIGCLAVEVVDCGGRQAAGGGARSIGAVVCRRGHVDGDGWLWRWSSGAGCGEFWGGAGCGADLSLAGGQAAHVGVGQWKGVFTVASASEFTA